MDKSQSKKKESGLFGKGQRYWSVMLVGEHGRIVPFHRFKEVALTVIGLSILSLSALVVLSFFYIQQGKKLTRLETELDELRQTATRLRDEKDVLKAKLVRKEISATPGLPKEQKKIETATKERDVDDSVKAQAPAAASEKSVQENSAPPKATPIPVKWAGDIKMFNVDYNTSKKILETKFRIYNSSVPKKQLAGRVVVIYKNSDDPPIKWLVVPRVPLKDGKPLGDNGKPFAVRNYRTMQFLAYGIPAPVKYNIVSVFVFRDSGELLLTRDFGMAIEVEPVPTPTPTPTPTPIPTVTPDIPVSVKPEALKPAEGMPQEGQAAVPSRSITPGPGESATEYDLPQVTRQPSPVIPATTPDQALDPNGKIPAGKAAAEDEESNTKDGLEAGQNNQRTQ